MTKQINTSIIINASADTVWSILMDTEKYPEWNPFVKSLTGDLKVGERIHIKLPAMSFKPSILTLKKNEEFKWLGHLLFKGLFDGEHKFHLKENEDGTTTFTHSEHFKGILVRLFSKSLDRDTKKGFEEMNSELKKRAERIDQI